MPSQHSTRNKNVWIVTCFKITKSRTISESFAYLHLKFLIYIICQFLYILLLCVVHTFIKQKSKNVYNKTSAQVFVVKLYGILQRAGCFIPWVLKYVYLNTLFMRATWKTTSQCDRFIVKNRCSYKKDTFSIPVIETNGYAVTSFCETHGAGITGYGP